VDQPKTAERRCTSKPRLPGQRTSVMVVRSGFTLLELMVVTTIIGILALVASIPLRKARERAYVAATRGEINTLLKHIAMYELQTGQLPSDLTQVKAEGFAPSGNINFCSYSRVVAPPDPPHVIIVAMHKGARTRIEVRHPASSANFVETEVTSACTPLVF
jgi:prepilin-type N-terminal cleavage/methylation domain-containing protein